MRSTLATLALSLSFSTGCFAQPALLTRADLAEAYVEVDRAYESNQPEDAAALAATNERFDRITLSFFTGRLNSAIEGLTNLLLDLRPIANSPRHRAVAGLQIRVEPPVGKAPFAGPLELRLASMFLLDRSAPEQLAFTAVLSNAEDAPLLQHEAVLARNVLPSYEDTLQLKLPEPLPPGRYLLTLRVADVVLAERAWYVVAEPLDLVRARNETQLAALTPDTPALREALAIAQARNNLLTDAPQPELSAQFLADYSVLVDAVGAELAALEAGRDPYQNKVGDYWRVLPRADAADVPLRVFAPEQVGAEPDAARPLVLAFHGAGGDENMFFDGYGAGAIKQLAAERGWLVAAPLTMPFLREPDLFDALLTSLAGDYAIDRERVFVLGHSLGAGTTLRLAGAHPDGIAAAALVAGASSGEAANADRLPPLLAILGELDPIARPRSTRRMLEMLRSAGAEIEIRERENYGHTLLVGAALPEVFAWFENQPR